MKRTVTEIADALGIEEKAARGLVAFLLGVKPPLVRFRGERETGRGRGPSVYEIDDNAPGAVEKILGRLA